MGVVLKDIIMDFPGARALDNVSAEFRFNEVHGLIGENGAGKSTFVNILGGSLQPTNGTISVDDMQARFKVPRDALLQGIAHVSQEGSLVPELSGAENIMLGDEPRIISGIINNKKLLAQAQSLLQSWFPEVEIDLTKPIIDLAMADQKIIEIVRGLRGNVRLLILDEPTATLENKEKQQLWDIIRQLPKKGIGVVLISHFLSEIKQLSDRITVLRDGKHVGTYPAAETSEVKLVDLMLKRENSTSQTSDNTNSSFNTGAEMLRVEDWHLGNITVPDFKINAGEIVGLIGLTGAGHFGFARSLYVLSGLIAGKIFIDGEEISSKSVKEIQNLGVAFIPDSRMVNALSGDNSVIENLGMVHTGFGTRGKTGIVNSAEQKTEAQRIINLLNIKISGQNQLIDNLSGGNKQKVSIGKWLYGAEDRYKIMIFIEPTEGVDIGAKQEIYNHIKNLAQKGMAVLIASSDLLEIENITDRVVPFIHGKPAKEITSDDFSESNFIAAIAGENS